MNSIIEEHKELMVIKEKKDIWKNNPWALLYVIPSL